MKEIDVPIVFHFCCNVTGVIFPNKPVKQADFRARSQAYCVLANPKCTY